MKLKVRPAIQKDIPAVFRLYQEFNHAKLGLKDFTKLVRRTRGRDYVFCGELGGKIVGYIIVKIDFDVEEPGIKAELTDFFITPKARGFGIGRTLLSSAIAFCKRKRAKRIMLLTHSTHTRADKLYRKVGFKKTKILTLYKRL